MIRDGGESLAQEVRARLPAVPEMTNPGHRRVLDAAARKGITLHILTFEEPAQTAADAARAVGARLGQIVKSLVFVAPSDGGLEGIVALVSGPNRVDADRLAVLVGLPGLRRASHQEAAELTGFPVGGIPPFGHRRALRVYMDADLGLFPQVWAAAGSPQAVFTVPPATLRMLANATVVPFAEGPAAPAIRVVGSPVPARQTATRAPRA